MANDEKRVIELEAEIERLRGRADAAWAHADRLQEQLEKPNWRPTRAHIEDARNTIRQLCNAIRGGK